MSEGRKRSRNYESGASQDAKRRRGGGGEKPLSRYDEKEFRQAPNKRGGFQNDRGNRGGRGRGMDRGGRGRGMDRGGRGRGTDRGDRGRGRGSFRGQGDRGRGRGGRRMETKSEKQIEKEKRLAKKYHHIKFYDRLKVERRLKPVLRKLEKDPENEELKKEKERYLDDLRYIRFFPRGEKYISLFTEDVQENVLEKQQRLRQFALHLSTLSGRGKPEYLLAFMNKKRTRTSQESDDSSTSDSSSEGGQLDEQEMVEEVEKVDMDGVVSENVDTSAKTKGSLDSAKAKNKMEKKKKKEKEGELEVVEKKSTMNDNIEEDDFFM